MVLEQFQDAWTHKGHRALLRSGIVSWRCGQPRLVARPTKRARTRLDLGERIDQLPYRRLYMWRHIC
jgi:hypothetical protein